MGTAAMSDGTHQYSDYGFAYFLAELKRQLNVLDNYTPQESIPYLTGSTTRYLTSNGVAEEILSPIYEEIAGVGTAGHHILQQKVFTGSGNSGALYEQLGRNQAIHKATLIPSGRQRYLSAGSTMSLSGDFPSLAFGASHEFFGQNFETNGVSLRVVDCRSGSGSNSIFEVRRAGSTNASANGTFCFGVSWIGETYTKGLRVKLAADTTGGTDALNAPRIGTGATLDGVTGSVTIANASITANTHIIITKTAHGAGVGGVSYVVTKSVGTSFTITAVDANGATVNTDTSVFDWMLVQRA
jgi:hypothetical protein